MVTLAVSLETKHLQTLIRHIEGVQQDCQILGTRLIERGEPDLGRSLIANGFIHDHSKFEGIEWEHLYSRNDPMFEAAWRHHVENNPHHPEYWQAQYDLSDAGQGLRSMPRYYIAEMVCDWHSRSSEMESRLSYLDWIDQIAMKRFNFGPHDEVGKQISDFVNLLLEHWN